MASPSSNWVAGTSVLQFGSDATALTSGQLAQINFSGYGAGARILSTDEVIPASHYIAVNTGSYSSAATWYGAAAPTGTYKAIHIHSGTLTVDGNQTVPSQAIASGATFAFESGQARVLTISSGGSITNTGGTFTADNGQVIFPGTADVTGTVTFNDVELSGGVNFGTSSTVNGTLTVKTGGFANTNSPTFGDGSFLDFATGGDYEVGALTTLWVTGAVRGQGVPANVTLTKNERAVFMNGTGAQTITGAATMIFDYLLIESGSSTTLASALEIDNDLTVTGTLATGGNLTIQNDAQILGAGTLSGSVIFQRELNGSDGWRMLSSPAANTTYSSLLDPIWTQGATAGADVTGGSPNVFTWNNSSTGTANSNWSGVTDLTTEVSPGTGLLV